MQTRIFAAVLIMMLVAPAAMAQGTGREKMSFAILGGVSLQNLNGKASNGDKIENAMILGYHGGVNLQIPLVPEFYFQPGLLFSTKGAKDVGILLTTTYKLSYIELPLNFMYKGLLGKGQVTLGFGPYLGYAIGGKAILEGGPVAIESDISFQNVVESGDPLFGYYFKAFDAGGNIFFGYELASGIFFQLDTQFGMLNINPENNRILNNELSLKNTGFGLSVGYRF